MRNYSFIKAMVLTMGLVFGLQTAYGQLSTMQDKQDHQNTLDENYDAWKRAQTQRTEDGKSHVMTSVEFKNWVTVTVQIGTSIVDQTAATSYENRLLQYPEIENVSVDFQSNTATYTILREDKERSLWAMFDIR